MTNDTQRKFEELIRVTLTNHPFFMRLSKDGSDDYVENFLNSVNALCAPKPETLQCWAESWIGYQKDMMRLWGNVLTGAQTNSRSESVSHAIDRRFGDPSWSENQVFDFIKQTYLLTARAMTSMADESNLPEHEQRKLSFYTRVALDALSPSNFPFSNPEVIKRARETNGQSLVDGFKNILEDMEKGYISTTDESAFEVGGNLATTPGSVIFRNDLIELIQYRPTEKQVWHHPLVIVPPCVNKFYIFDINERKSMVRYALDQGRNVFMVSWRNPGPDQKDNGWDEYIGQGVYTALEIAHDVTGAEKADLLSWCNGGTLTLAALAVMNHEQRNQVATATFLSSMIDFSDPGEVEVFVDRPQVDVYGQRLKKARVMPGRDIAQAMAMLHVNESIWNFVVNNYLLGKAPAPFDILYWNSDTANLPARWYSYYIENMYLHNRLREPGALTLLGTPVDTRAIDVPCYFLATTGDHIVPWKTSFLATGLVGGETEFVLSDGGHVSGTVINHPVKSKRYYRTKGEDGNGPEHWRDTAEIHEGSWWPHWFEWLARHSGGGKVTAPESLGNRTHAELAPAPGTYVVEDVPQRY